MPGNLLFIAIVAVYFIGESLLIGDCTIMKGALLMVAWMAFTVVAYMLFWHKKEASDDDGALLAEGAPA